MDGDDQRRLGRIVVQRFSLRWYFDTARRCKLYDTDLKLWTDYRGKRTIDAAPEVRTVQRAASDAADTANHAPAATAHAVP